MHSFSGTDDCLSKSNNVITNAIVRIGKDEEEEEEEELEEEEVEETE